MKKKEIEKPLKTGITKLKLENVKMFKDFEIDLTDPEDKKSPARWVNLIGNNGTGKTTLLRHIYLSGLDLDALQIIERNNRFRYEQFKEGNSILSVNIDNYKFKDVKLKYPIYDLQLEKYNKDRGGTRFWMIVVSNPHYLITDSEIENYSEGRERLEMGVLLFSNPYRLPKLAKLLTDIKNSNEGNDNDKNSKNLSHHNYEEIIAFINEYTSNFGFRFEEITIEPLYDFMFSEIKSRNELMYNISLSSGFNSIFYIFGTILQYLLIISGPFGKEKPWKEDFTVLIDELDSHFHPQWRRIIPSILQKVFPNAQFIVTTHSPVLVQNSGVNAVTYVLNKDNEGNVYPKRIEDAAAMDIERLMESPAFGLESTYSIDLEEANDKKNQIAYGEDLQLTKGEEKLLQKSRKNVPLNPELEKEILKFLKKNG